MKRITAGLCIGIVLVAVQALAGNGDLVVDGTLGVGTTTPSFLTEIVGGSSGAEATLFQVRSKFSGLNTGTTIALANSTNPTAGSGRVELAATRATASGGAFVIRTGDSGGYIQERLRINDAGNVGIGTTTPASKLTIYGVNTSIRVDAPSGAGNGPGGLVLAQDGTTYSQLGLYSGIHNSTATHTELMLNTGSHFIISNGRVGVGRIPDHAVDVNGQVRADNVQVTSDIKFKENITPVEGSLEKIMGLEGVTFNWKKKAFPERDLPEGRHYGVIAQEVEKILPEVVNTGSDGTKSVAYTELIPVLIEAIKEQQKEIEQLKKTVANLQK
jgi:hypothetical protein